jgi:hypothetical protein
LGFFSPICEFRYCAGISSSLVPVFAPTSSWREKSQKETWPSAPAARRTESLCGHHSRATTCERCQRKSQTRADRNAGTEGEDGDVEEDEEDEEEDGDEEDAEEDGDEEER